MKLDFDITIHTDTLSLEFTRYTLLILFVLTWKSHFLFLYLRFLKPVLLHHPSQNVSSWHCLTKFQILNSESRIYLISQKFVLIQENCFKYWAKQIFDDIALVFSVINSLKILVAHCLGINYYVNFWGA